VPPAECALQPQSLQVWHRNIEDHEIGLHFLGMLHGFESVGGFTNHFKSFSLQVSADLLSKWIMVIYDQDSEGAVHTPLSHRQQGSSKREFSRKLKRL
jgi:hypothetical protein